MRELFGVRHVEIDWRDVDLILVRELLELGFVVWGALQLLTGVDFLVVDHGDEDDVHTAVDGAKDLLPLLVVRLVDVMRALVEINCFQFGDVVIEARQDNIGHNFVSDTCLPDVFDSYGARDLFVLEGFSELFVGHPVFLGFAEAILLLQGLIGISLQLRTQECVNLLVFAQQA